MIILTKLIFKITKIYTLLFLFFKTIIVCVTQNKMSWHFILLHKLVELLIF